MGHRPPPFCNLSVDFDPGTTNKLLVSIPVCLKNFFEFLILFFVVASQSLDTLAQLVDDQDPAIVKVVIQCLTAVYPLLFRILYAS